MAGAANAAENVVRGLPPPRGFDGTRPELWKEFPLMLKAYMDLQEHYFSTNMDSASISPQAITDEWQTLDHHGESVPDERLAQVSRHLKNLLISLCNGPVGTITTSPETLNGFELWRQLHQRYSSGFVASQHGNLEQIPDTISRITYS